MALGALLEPGTLVQERYRIVAKIGSGGMGAVYDALDTRLDVRVALKQMQIVGEIAERAFHREARLLAGLRHPALPRVTDHFDDPLGRFLVMEYVPGESLSELLAKQTTAFPLATVVGWANRLLEALSYLHSREPAVIHRDIKPSNIKLTPNNEIVLLDFGLARDQRANLTTTTSAATLVAFTPGYAPPEQTLGRPTGVAGDLYALAATCFHLLTGQPPIDALSRTAALAQGRPDPLIMPTNLPPQMVAWLRQALDLDPAQRFGSANAMRRALESVPLTAQTGTTQIAPAPPTVPIAPLPAQGQRWTWVMIGLGLVVFALFAVIMVLFLLPPPAAVPSSTAQVALPTAVPPLATRTPRSEPSPLAEQAAALANPSPTASEPTETRPSSTPVTLIAATAAPSYGPSGPLRPAEVSASASAPNGIDGAGNPVRYSPDQVSDGLLDTAWRVPGDGIGNFVQLNFASRVRVREVQMVPGYAKTDPVDNTDRFLQNRRVARVQLIFSEGQTIEVELADQRALQQIVLPTAIETTSLRVVILASRPPALAQGRDFTPISEIVVIGERQIN